MSTEARLSCVCQWVLHKMCGSSLWVRSIFTFPSISEYLMNHLIRRAFRRFYQKFIETAFPTEDIYLEWTRCNQFSHDTQNYRTSEKIYICKFYVSKSVGYFFHYYLLVSAVIFGWYITIFMELIPLNCDNVTVIFSVDAKNVCLKMNIYSKLFYIMIYWTNQRSSNFAKGKSKPPQI